MSVVNRIFLFSVFLFGVLWCCSVFAQENSQLKGRPNTQSANRSPSHNEDGSNNVDNDQTEDEQEAKDDAGVKLPKQKFHKPEYDPFRKNLSISLLGVSVAAAITSAITGFLAIEAQKESESGLRPIDARRAEQRHEKYSIIAISTLVAAFLIGTAAWYLWPEDQSPRPFNISTNTYKTNSSVLLGFSW